MMRKTILLTAAILCGIAAEEADARSKRVRQIPNGSALSCNGCHTAGGGSSLNSFGLAIDASFLSSAGRGGDVLWGPELAALDSDGDGASNGAELGDPEGAWAIGDPDPEGDEVFSPGDSMSAPPAPPEPPDTAIELSTWAQIKQLTGVFD